MLIYTLLCVDNNTVRIHAGIAKQKHHFLGNSHTIAPEVKVSNGSAARFRLDCRRRLYCLYFSSRMRRSQPSVVLWVAQDYVV
jgi:hypothetical protein